MTPPGLPISELSGHKSGPELLERVRVHLADSGWHGRIEQVEIGKSGAVNVLLNSCDGRKWLALGDGAAQELSAGADGQIPLCHQLKNRGSEDELKILAYRPARRIVILDSRNQNSCVIKAYRKGRGKEAAGKFSLASNALVDSHIMVPQPVQLNQLHDYLTMPFLSGDRLQVSADHADHFRVLGEGIRDLQQFAAGNGQLAEFTRRQERAVLEERARRLRLVDSAFPADWDRLYQRLEQALGRIHPAAAVTTHRDLHDGQLLLTPEGPALLDFDLMCRAEPELDPANFLAHLALRGLQRPDRISEHDVHACSKKFLDGMDLYEKPGFWERLRFYQTSSLCRLALVYSLRPEWTFTVPALVLLGHRCMDDLQRLLP